MYLKCLEYITVWVLNCFKNCCVSSPLISSSLSRQGFVHTTINLYTRSVTLKNILISYIYNYNIVKYCRRSIPIPVFYFENIVSAISSFTVFASCFFFEQVHMTSSSRPIYVRSKMFHMRCMLALADCQISPSLFYKYPFPYLQAGNEKIKSPNGPKSPRCV